MIFFDTEGLGLVSPTTTIQTKWGPDAPTNIHLVWDEPCRETLCLIEKMLDEDICGFNIVFDWFHIQRLYCILRLLDPSRPPSAEGWLRVQREAVFGPCVKPKAALDLMLHAMQGPLQSTMERDDIRIRKVPIQLAYFVARELQARLQLPGIYFHYRENGYEWRVEPIEDKPGFADVVLRWGASRGLKPIGKHVLGLDVIEYEVPKEHLAEEDTWNPFGDKWVRHLPWHAAYWRLDPRARRYATEDVEKLTYGLWRHFGCPEAGDTNSTLACAVGSMRWRGFALDLPLLEQLEGEAVKAMEAFPRAPKPVLHGLKQRCSPVEAIGIEDTCAETLAEIGGTREGDKWVGGWGDNHPASQWARGVTTARSKEKEADMCRKLLSVGSFHPDSKIIGALSGRMSGAGGINMHGIPGKQKGSRMREAFLLAERDGWVLDAGDFDSFEVAIAAAVYDDANLTADLKSGKKIHAIYGSVMLEMEYDVVKANKGLYNDSKRAFLGRLYGAQDPKVSKVLNRPLEQIQRNEKKLAGRYPGIGRARQETADRFCSMRQEGGVGSRIEWREPAEYEESLFGYRRYFTLENRIARVLFDLGQSPPGDLRDGAAVERSVGRRQTAGGATQSALFAAAFGIQASAMRQAANHRIQSTGAWITKELQRAIWDLQPVGVHAWCVRPMQIHDEIQCPRLQEIDLEPVVRAVVDRFQPRIPLLRMDWMRNLRSWAEKG